MTPRRPPQALIAHGMPVRAFSTGNLAVVIAQLLLASTDDQPPPDQCTRSTMNTSDRPTLSIAQTAELLGISRWLVQQAVRDGSLPSKRIGRRILIPTARLDAWLQGEPAQSDGIGDATRTGQGETETRPMRVRAV